MALETNQFVHPCTEHPYCFNGFSFKAHTKSYFCFLRVMKLCLPSALAKSTVMFVGVGALCYQYHYSVSDTRIHALPKIYIGL